METDSLERILRALNRRRPCVPFLVEFVNGEKTEVDHPEALVVRGGVAVYLVADGTPYLVADGTPT